MNNAELADLYIKLSMKYEEEFPVQCGFEIATKKQMIIIDKIRSGSLSKKDIKIIEPIFSYGNIVITNHVRAQKRFLFF